MKGVKEREWVETLCADVNLILTAHECDNKPRQIKVDVDPVTLNMDGAGSPSPRTLQSLNSKGNN